MEELEKVLSLLGKYGWQPILSVSVLWFVWSVSRPADSEKAPLLAAALSRVWSDLCRAVGVWWADRQEDVDAKRLERQEDAAAKRELTRAQASLQGALERSVLAANPGGTRAIDRAVYGDARSDVRTTGGGPGSPERVFNMARQAENSGTSGNSGSRSLDGGGADGGPITLAPPGD